MVGGITLSQIHKRFAGRRADPLFADFTLSIAEGSATAILGRSGVGKSTLLNLLLGTEEYQGGTINVPDTAKPIAQVSQIDSLLPWRTVRDNGILGCQLSSQRFDRKELVKLLTDLDLIAYSRYYPSQLSGGMARKVHLARALLMSPRTLLLDEPFTNLDFGQRMFLCDYVGFWHRKNDSQLILVTHDAEEAIMLCDRIVVLAERPARVILDMANPLRLPGGPERPSSVRDNPDFAKLAKRVHEEIR